MFRSIKNFFSNMLNNINMDPTERYLSESVDLVDLENRLRDIQTDTWRNKGYNQANLLGGIPFLYRF